MNIGLWNIDHPESRSGVLKKERRFREVVDYLYHADCDAYIITEANAAIELPGYFREFSEESPFRSSRRYHEAPNRYHQVAIYSRNPLKRMDVLEPINGLHCTISGSGQLTRLYGNVITIKDQWSKISSKSYADRLDEQIHAIEALPADGTLVGGDFNLRHNWPQKRLAHRAFKEKLASNGWIWPTETRGDTAQHVLHSSSFEVEVELDFGVKYDETTGDGLSDHPFVRIQLAPP